MFAIGIGISPVFGSPAAVIVPATALRQRDTATIRDRAGSLIHVRS